MSDQPTPLSEAQIHAEQMAFAERTVRSAQVWHNAGGEGPRSTACPQQYEIAPGAELLYSGNPRAPHRLPLVW